MPYVDSCFHVRNHILFIMSFNFTIILHFHCLLCNHDSIFCFVLFFLNHGAVSHICHNHNFSNMCSFRNSLKRAAFDLLRWEFCLAGFRSLFRGLWIPPDCYVPFCSLLDSLPPHYLFGALKDAPKSMFVLVGIYSLLHSRLYFLSLSFSTCAFVISPRQ